MTKRKSAATKSAPTLITSDLHVDADLAVRAGQDEERKNLLARVRSGEITELDIQIVAFRAKYPNANYLRFRDEDLSRFAGSFGGQPFLRNHDVWDVGSRDGTIVEGLIHNDEFMQTVRLTTQRGMEDYLQGRIDRFSIGWYYDDIQCSVCGERWYECNHYPGRRYGEHKDKLCELVFVNPTGKETSAVNAPAVQGTRVLWTEGEDGDEPLTLPDAIANLCELKQEFQANLQAANHKQPETPPAAEATDLPPSDAVLPATMQSPPEVLTPAIATTEENNTMDPDEVVDAGQASTVTNANPAPVHPTVTTTGATADVVTVQALPVATATQVPDITPQLNQLAEAQSAATEWLTVLRESAIANALQASGLGQESQQAVRIALGDNYTPARLNQLIDAQRKAEAALADRNVVRGLQPTDVVRITGMLSDMDQFKAAMHSLLDPSVPLPKGVRPLTGIREAYILATGDFEMTGMFNSDRVYLANVNTSTMSDLMAEFLNMRLVTAFQNYPQFWRFLVREENFTTLHDPHWLMLGGIGELSDVAEGSAYTEREWSVQTETTTWVKKGNWLGITIEAIDKDLTGYLQQAPQALAQAAYLSLGKSFTRMFTTANGPGYGPSMRDQKALFHADHNNLDALAFSYSNWETVRLAMARQTELGSGEILGGLTVPRYLMIPRHLEGTVLKVLATEQMPGGSLNDINPLAVPGASVDARRNAANNMILVNDFLGTANNWYAFADPNMYPLVGLGYRFGRTPEIYSLRIAEQTQGLLFTNDVLPIKVRFFFSMGPIDYRGMFRNTVN
jgi:hypothetical protein